MICAKLRCEILSVQGVTRALLTAQLQQQQRHFAGNNVRPFPRKMQLHKEYTITLLLEYYLFFSLLLCLSYSLCVFLVPGIELRIFTLSYIPGPFHFLETES